MFGWSVLTWFPPFLTAAPLFRKGIVPHGAAVCIAGNCKFCFFITCQNDDFLKLGLSYHISGRKVHIFVIYFIHQRMTKLNSTKERDYMKKLIALILSLTFMMSLAGCGKAISGAEVYSFPEPTIQIVVSYASQGNVTEYTIGSENYDANDFSTQPVIKWFYGLELEECEKPEDVEGNNGYSFSVDGEYAFYYDDRGSTAFVSVADKYYEVKNPSTPPIE